MQLKEAKIIAYMMMFILVIESFTVSAEIHIHAETPVNYSDTSYILQSPWLVQGEDGIEYMAYDIVKFGSYPQSDISGEKKEPIKWRVLDVNGDNVLLWADSILDYCKFDLPNMGGRVWDTCDIRRWLTEEFVETAFTSSEKSAIQKAVHAVEIPETDEIVMVEDTVFLPDYYELRIHNYKDCEESYRIERQMLYWRYGTAYADAKFERLGCDKSKWDGYWLRTPGVQKGIYNYIRQEIYEPFGNSSIWSNSSIDLCSVYLGVCPMLYVSKDVILEKNAYIETQTIVPYEKYEPPYLNSGSDNGENGGEETENGNGESGESGEGTENGGNGSGEGTENGENGSGIEESGEGADTGDNVLGENTAVSGGEGTDAGSSETGAVGKGNSVLQDTKYIGDALLGELGDIVYTGKEICPDPGLIYKGKLLQKDIDYKVDFSNNVDAGIAHAHITGCGEYTGDIGWSFTIKPRVINGLNSILKGKDGNIYKAVYTGKKIKPKTSFRLPMIVDGKKCIFTPQEGKDYSVEYLNNNIIGTATITYRFYGNYNGLVTKEFQIVPGKVTKLTAKKKGSKTVLSWKKAKGASGYEIYRASKKNGTYKRIARIGNKSKYTDKKTKGKKYYYKVCAFGKQSGIRYYGEKVRVKAK